MVEEFYAQMLVLLLCFLSGIRIFFIKNPRIDCFALPAQLALFVAVFIYFAFGVSIQTIAVSVVAIVFSITNFRSFFRVCSKLVIDRYSIPFVIATLIEMGIVLFVGAALVYFSPVKIDSKKLGVTKIEKKLSGNLATHFKIEETLLKNQRIKLTGFLSIYESETKKVENSPVVLFVSNPYGSVRYYEPYLYFLAQGGYTVLAVDFYSPDMAIFDSYKDSMFFRRFFSLKEYYDSKKDKSDGFKKIEEKNISHKVDAYKELARLSSVLYGNRKVYYICDQMNYDSIFSLIEYEQVPSAGFFTLNGISEYKTAGLGFIGQTDLFFAHLLNFGRDRSFFVPKYLATKTIQDLEFRAEEHDD